ncbi:MAG: esterase-like activity of phytase family protein [Desulfovibrionaceae bacterium]|nr:esterase-like activity of phytase family protein [Desulfovibrionaceae bacterium]MBF0513947.1 esterase-like activity of phytase family protein [Desulfovibrionaceae bacterium]
MAAYVLLALTLLLCAPAQAAAPKPTPPASARFAVEIEKTDYVPCQGQACNEFPDGFAPGVGAGLAPLADKTGGGKLFITVSGRGPSAEGPRFLDKNDRLAGAGRFFPAPAFSPCLAVLEIGETGAKLARTIPLQYEKGGLSGRPIPLGQTGTTAETLLAEDLTVLPRDPGGLSPQAAAVGPDKTGVWIADDYGPFLLRADLETGRIAARLAPGEGLPEILTLRQDNKGFSGVTVTPSGRVVLSLRAALSADGAPRQSKTAFIRLVEYDPATGAARMFAYPIEPAVYRRAYDAQICGLAAVSETKFLLVEQGKDKSGAQRNAVCLVDLAQANDISDLKTQDGAPLELAGQKKDLETLGVKFPKRTEILDLRAADMKTGQASGLTLLPDRQTLLVAQTGDYGLTSAVENPVTTETGQTINNPSFYTFDAKKRVWWNNTPAATKFSLKNTGAAPAIWRITLGEPLEK